jgi:hypothetical protein
MLTWQHGGCQAEGHGCSSHSAQGMAGVVNAYMCSAYGCSIWLQRAQPSCVVYLYDVWTQAAAVIAACKGHQAFWSVWRCGCSAAPGPVLCHRVCACTLYVLAARRKLWVILCMCQYWTNPVATWCVCWCGLASIWCCWSPGKCVSNMMLYHALHGRAKACGVAGQPGVAVNL